MGVALSACTVPHAGSPSFDLEDNEIEIGIGIHGEPGRHKIPMENADAITDMLLEPVLSDLGIAAGDKVLLFVNGMGGTPLSELYIVYRRAAQRVIADKGATVERSLVGNYITALEMQGCSISVLRLDDELTGLWDAPVHTAALRWGVVAMVLDVELGREVADALAPRPWPRTGYGSSNWTAPSGIRTTAKTWTAASRR